MTVPKPIKILHIIPQIGIGGAESQLYALIVNSNPSQVQHEVLYYSDSKDEECYHLYRQGGVAYSRVPRNKYRPVKFMLDFSREIRRRQPDIVQCWLVSANFWGRIAAMLAGQRDIIISWRSSNVWNPIGMRVLEWFSSNRVHHLANSFACAQHVAKEIRISPEKIHVTYNGFDLDKFNLPPNPDFLRQQLKIPDNCRIITNVGRLTAAKNQQMILKVAVFCKKENLNVRFVIVGHGEKEQELKTMAVDLGVTDIVYFLGLRQDIPQILKASDMFLFTSIYEGFPNALLEAMAAGLPIVTTDFDGAFELIQAGENGAIVPINDIEQAVSALKKYMQNDPFAQKCAVMAQSKAFQRFDMNSMVNNNINFYKSIT